MERKRNEDSVSAVLGKNFASRANRTCDKETKGVSDRSRKKDDDSLLVAVIEDFSLSDDSLVCRNQS